MRDCLSSDRELIASCVIEVEREEGGCSGKQGGHENRLTYTKTYPQGQFTC